MRWGTTIEEYLCDQQAHGRINSWESVRTYQRILNLHAGDTPAGPVDASREDCKRTLCRWPHPNTRALAHTVLASFYDWLVSEGHRPYNPARQVARVRERKPQVYRLTRGEVVALVAACETVRERRVILLGACAGARSAELIGLKGQHFQREGFVWFSGDIAKGKRERWVPILSDLAGVVGEIRATVGPEHHVIRATTNNGVTLRPPTQPISQGALGGLVARVARRAGLGARITPHSLRHAYGDHIARHAGLRAAQALLGHASVQTTAARYVDRPPLDELVESVDGLSYGEARPRLERFERQMRQVSETTTRSVMDRTHEPIDMKERTMVRWVVQQ